MKCPPRGKVRAADQVVSPAHPRIRWRQHQVVRRAEKAGRHAAELVASMAAWLTSTRPRRRPQSIAMSRPLARSATIFTKPWVSRLTSALRTVAVGMTRHLRAPLSFKELYNQRWFVERHRAGRPTRAPASLKAGFGVETHTHNGRSKAAGRGVDRRRRPPDQQAAGLESDLEAETAGLVPV